MVDKHREKLKKEKEEAALAALQQSVPHVGIGVCVLALEGTAWEAEAAVKLLQSFEVDKGPQLAAIQQVPLEYKGHVNRSARNSWGEVIERLARPFYEFLCSRFFLLYNIQQLRANSRRLGHWQPDKQCKAK